MLRVQVEAGATPRRERYFLPDQSLPVTQRGNDWRAIFFTADGDAPIGASSIKIPLDMFALCS